MPNKKITALNPNTSPTFNDVFPIVNNGETKKLTLAGLSNFLQTSAQTPKYWISDTDIIIDSDETTIISGNYVLENCNLTINTSNISITANTLNSSVLTFDKYGQLFIGGYLLLINSNIINNGLISVGGAAIFSGTSTITGTGILI
jgi:hypothetical protein